MQAAFFMRLPANGTPGRWPVAPTECHSGKLLCSTCRREIYISIERAALQVQLAIKRRPQQSRAEQGRAIILACVLPKLLFVLAEPPVRSLGSTCPPAGRLAGDAPSKGLSGFNYIEFVNYAPHGSGQ